MRNGAYHLGIGICLVLSTLGCHRDSGLHQVELFFPVVLKGDHELWSRFKKQVTDLEITAIDQGKILWVRHFEISESEFLSISEAELASEGITLEVKVWDRNREGRSRTHPCLKGEGKWWGHRARIYLSMEVPLEEYRDY